MNFIIKVILSGILVVQFSFSETVLFYQRPSVKSAIEFLGSQPTLDEVAKTIAFARMDAKALVTMRKILKGKGVSLATPMPRVELSGNRFTIEGLTHPLIIGNSERLEISYNGEVISLKNPKDIEQTFKDIELFFRNDKTVKFPFLYMGLGESAHAITMLAYMIAMAILGIVGVGYRWWGSNKAKGLEDWPFSVDNFGKSIDLKCESGRLAITCGNEKLSFYATESSTHNIDYVNIKKSQANGTLTVIPEFDIPKGTGRFANAFYSNQRKKSIAQMAKIVLGEDGRRQICDGNQFVEDLGRVYTEIAKQATIQSRQKDKAAATKTLKSLDSGSQSR